MKISASCGLMTTNLLKYARFTNFFLAHQVCGAVDSGFLSPLLGTNPTNSWAVHNVCGWFVRGKPQGAYTSLLQILICVSHFETSSGTEKRYKKQLFSLCHLTHDTKLLSHPLCSSFLLLLYIYMA